MRNADRYTYREEWSEEDNVYIARCLEFPSLNAHGDSPEGALKELRGVVADVLDDMTDAKEPIPEPFGSRAFSGKLSLRLPRHIHRELAIRAAEEDVSLNTYIASCLI